MRSRSYEETAVTVGRLTRIKNVHEIIEAVAYVRRDGVDLNLNVTGGPLTADDLVYDRDVRSLVERLGLSTAVRFTGPIPFTEIGDQYRRGGVFINLCESALDKAILESMASGCIPVSRNPAFQALADSEGLEWLVPEPGPHGLADRMASVLRRAREDRRGLVDRLRRIVAEEHSLSTLSDRIVDHLSDLARAPRPLRGLPKRREI
jgi:phosphatidylinositol alpha-1,6-mannosyltransferase